MRQGIPLFAQTLSVGPLAYPPTPTAARGLNWLTILRAMRSLFHILKSTTMFFSRCLRSNPQMGRPLISYPAAGTRCNSRAVAPTSNPQNPRHTVAAMPKTHRSASIPPPFCPQKTFFVLAKNRYCTQNTQHYIGLQQYFLHIIQAYFC